jgi:hypothetical protein
VIGRLGLFWGHSGTPAAFASLHKQFFDIETKASSYLWYQNYGTHEKSPTPIRKLSLSMLDSSHSSHAYLNRQILSIWAEEECM